MQAAIQNIFKHRPDLGSVIKRFPIASLIMALFTLLIIFDEVVADKDKFALLLLGLVVSAYVSFCITIARETRDNSRFIVLQIIMAFAICALAWFSDDLNLNPFMALGAVLLTLGNMILWRSGRDDLKLWDFTHKIWSGAIFATVGAIIFTLGLFAISSALKSLLGIDVSKLIREVLLPVGLGFLAPLYWLSTIPPVDEPYDDLYQNPGFVSKAVAFFGTWLLSPLTLIYSFILLAYGVKIIALGELPKGEIAALTLPFLMIGTLTWLILEPPFIKDKALAKLFRKTWFLVSLPAVFLLGVSVFERVHSYGLTPERILLIMAVIWALGIGLWFLFAPKTRRDIRYIPGFAAVLLLIGAFFAHDLSLRSQAHRLEVHLKASGRINTENEIISLQKNDESAKKAKGALQYLFRHKGEKRVEKILNRYGYEGALEQSKINEALGLADISLPSRYDKYISSRYKLESDLFDISEYNGLIGPFQHYFPTNDKVQNIYTSDLYEITSQANKLYLSFQGKRLADFDVEAWLEENLNEITDKGYYGLPDDPISFYEGQGVRIDMRVSDASLTKQGDDTTSLNAGFLFLISREADNEIK